MNNVPPHRDDAAPPAENQLAPSGQSSAISVRPSPELAAQFPALNRALVFLGQKPLKARAPSLPEKCPARRRSRKSLPSHRPTRGSKRFIALPPERETPLERHQRKCAVCHHAEREAIEDLFTHWHTPSQLAYEYDLDLRSIYRHAHATGLLRARRRNLRCVLEHILEDAMRVQVTSDSVVRAVRAYTCLTSDNRWIEPATRVTFSSDRRPPKSRKSNRQSAIRK